VPEEQPVEVTSPLVGTVVSLPVAEGDEVAADAAVAFVEAMKMEHRVPAPTTGRIAALRVAEGDTVERGQVLAVLTPGAPPVDHGDPHDDPAGRERADLDEVRRRRHLITDDARREVVRDRHERGRRTARENVAALLDPGSMSELGGLAIAAQRRRRGVEELQRRTPADGLVTGTGTVHADHFGPERSRVAVAAYDYTVLAGTQGWVNHHKKDRLFDLALRLRLPTVLFAEGGGGRPGDTDNLGASRLDAEAFARFAALSGRVPTIAVVDGYCFAGNAALAGCADVLVLTRDASLGMAGPAMIEGGGLGSFAPEDVGPTAVHAASGVADVVVDDDVEAVEVARRLLGYTQGALDIDAPHADQTRLRDAVPEDRKRPYDVRALLETLADDDSVLELRRDAAPGIVTAFARIRGRAVGVLANDPTHLGGAIDADAADSAARHLRLCDAYGLPIVVLCDTPGFMVGPDAERDAGVRRFGRLFLAGASLEVPLVCVVTRKAYGLGAQAMMGGHLRVPVLTIGWPTAELGPMGLEGAVRLGFRRELDAIEDPAERERAEAEMIASAHQHAAGLNVASFGEIDDVIDPADTRERIEHALRPWPRDGRPRDRYVDVW
jgi:acetyl-CoA carboxylase carboxyltransferase component